VGIRGNLLVGAGSVGGLAPDNWIGFMKCRARRPRLLQSARRGLVRLLDA